MKPGENSMEDGESIDVESYQSEGEQQFSHQQLVMKIMIKCIDAGSREMRAGYFNLRQDHYGNTIKVYIEDTRRVFIESVETLEVVMACDLDKEVKDNISKIKKELDKTYEDLCKEEAEDWNTTSGLIKKQRWSNGIFYRKGSLNTNLPYYNDYTEFEVKALRKIFAELTKLTERKDFYKGELLEA